MYVCMVCMSLQAKDEQSAMEEKYRNELNAHVKLSSLYKVRITTCRYRILFKCLRINYPKLYLHVVVTLFPVSSQDVISLFSL